MNNKRRVLLHRASSYLSIASGIISNAIDDEQDCLDNMPENLQDSDRYSKMYQAIDAMECAISDIDNAIDNIGRAQE